jgi:hypothetical protein
MLALHMSVSVVWALAVPFAINLINRILSISTLRLNCVKVIFYTVNLILFFYELSLSLFALGDFQVLQASSYLSPLTIMVP